MLLFISTGIGLLGFTATTLVQRYLANDNWGVAVAKGLVMGIFAGVPYPVAGTVIGAPLLIWAGVHKWIKLPSSGNNQIVDSAFKNSSRAGGQGEGMNIKINIGEILSKSW